jgi:hypothetical protein
MPSCNRLQARKDQHHSFNTRDNCLEARATPNDVKDATIYKHMECRIQALSVSKNARCDFVTQTSSSVLAAIPKENISGLSQPLAESEEKLWFNDRAEFELFTLER